jgi:hypothetical protein
VQLLRKNAPLAALGATVLLGAALLGGGRLKVYLDTDPRLCVACHRSTPEFALWAGGTHRSVPCQRCHHASPEGAASMLRAFFLGARASAGRTAQHAAVEADACDGCHLSHDPRWKQMAEAAGHRVHVREQRVACVTCHAAGLHGFAPVSASCVRCHPGHAVRTPKMQFHCFACHDFLSPDGSLRPSRRDCLRCHRNEGVSAARFPADAPMQFACRHCHKPHAEEAGAQRVDCQRCHGDARRAGLHRVRAHADCVRCHRAHLWRPSEDRCSECHPVAPAHAEGRACRECHGWRGMAAPSPPADPP